jgi:UPF0042 nucleotide-binding protein
MMGQAVEVSEHRFNGPFVITGLSGSGKTVLSRSLEDIGYLCVDNIPLDLVPSLFESTRNDMDRLVVVVDVRTHGLIERLPTIYRNLVSEWKGLRLIFIEAKPTVLLRRFSVARRPHPLRDRSLEKAIADECESLGKVRELADLIIDTTDLSPHDLRRQVLSLAGVNKTRQLMSVEVQSFSYLQGVPPTASLVFDVRFLPNPYFNEELRHLPGDDPAVAAWLDELSEVAEAIQRLTGLVHYLLPHYASEPKSHLTIAIGCTGGRHRSVYIAERVARAIRESDFDVVVHHRDKDRWRYS